MHLVKRIEIIANSFELSKILDSLNKSGVHGHAVIRNVAGQGLREGTEDLDMTMLDNVYIIAFCMPDQLKGVVENVRPLLNKFGGTCYISDVMEIRSVKCIASL
ncbi:P-II family nitrogen regulator [Desertifilum sp. FACHB-1129]|uniref:Transcriptional regulator n=2 Tax=Desertifilum tharense IPPAS B-1220 TaxID=1781255 RepID=A0A1E5QGG1_9CYAN|nr:MULTISPECIES: P-II family nitrogen regulator [Desertifilum]MCD8486029.1 P-II family nitrogen regulator [Desertifilum sp.]MDA0208935.1 P-II family nitrogen regulator [Cyanobacteria bacterium FC1]NES97951.1 P-II family nitrogen regulator [Desertifilum sp. SIO1I2]MBD2310418.1 P-II family nitrogen regulator [Desertifilum sp. FACHB-1129]MBD2321870.1 P-II family nitrogen regulator [Desertifilum sp. FACHB-866]